MTSQIFRPQADLRLVGSICKTLDLLHECKNAFTTDALLDKLVEHRTFFFRLQQDVKFTPFQEKAINDRLVALQVALEEKGAFKEFYEQKRD